MKIYWTDKLSGFLAIVVDLPYSIKAIILLLMVLFPFYEKGLNFYLEWRKQEFERNFKRVEIKRKINRTRKPPS